MVLLVLISSGGWGGGRGRGRGEGGGDGGMWQVLKNGPIWESFLVMA